ncbi:hypothetical protein Ocin01_16685 [Orchesella cincta]|uniref:Uncharacterized protein n=1 Tax=Orchesella cincta TaxID=48709 RepID=A0A1D2MAI4_ORCCI|nr:hypothetical protein Ocin01_16685 [Orchesella cincta]
MNPSDSQVVLRSVQKCQPEKVSTLQQVNVSIEPSDKTKTKIITTNSCSSALNTLCYGLMWPLLVIIEISRFGLSIYRIFSSIDPLKPQEYCKMFIHIIYACKQLLFLRTVYKQQDKIQSYLSAVNTNSFLQKRREGSSIFRQIFQFFRWKLLLLVFIFGVYFSNHFRIVRNVFYKFDESADYNQTQEINGTSDFMENDSDYDDESNGIKISLVEILELIFVIAILVDYFLIVIFYLLPVPMLIALQKWETFFDDCKSEADYQGLLKKYDELRQLSYSGNKAWASLNLLWIIDDSTMLILDFNDMMKTHDLLNIWYLFGNQVLLYTALLMSTEIPRRLERAKHRFIIMQRNKKMESYPVIHELSEKLNDCPVGIGTTGLYTVHYAFVCQLLTSVVIALFTSFPPG